MGLKSYTCNQRPFGFLIRGTIAEEEVSDQVWLLCRGLFSMDIWVWLFQATVAFLCPAQVWGSVCFFSLTSASFSEWIVEICLNSWRWNHRLMLLNLPCVVLFWNVTITASPKPKPRTQRWKSSNYIKLRKPTSSLIWEAADVRCLLSPAGVNLEGIRHLLVCVCICLH